MDPIEVWRPVIGFESRYEVSALGRVRSLFYSKVMQQSHAGRGYPTVTLCVSSRPRSTYVHHLVAAAFIGERPLGMDVCHGDGDVTNNTVVNLRYDTRNANMRDAIAHGTHRSAERVKCPQGHHVVGDNVYELRSAAADGGTKVRRRCKQCIRDRAARYYARRKAA